MISFSARDSLLTQCIPGPFDRILHPQLSNLFHHRLTQPQIMLHLPHLDPSPSNQRCSCLITLSDSLTPLNPLQYIRDHPRRIRRSRSRRGMMELQPRILQFCRWVRGFDRLCSGSSSGGSGGGFEFEGVEGGGEGGFSSGSSVV